jgi:hypothetical protein
VFCILERKGFASTFVSFDKPSLVAHFMAPFAMQMMACPITYHPSYDLMCHCHHPLKRMLLHLLPPRNIQKYIPKIVGVKHIGVGPP